MSQTTAETPTINKLNRSSYPEKKVKLYDDLQNLAKSYNVIALSKMTKVRSAQLMSIRKKIQTRYQDTDNKEQSSSKIF
jgi:large subunit ribosomal protein L10